MINVDQYPLIDFQSLRWLYSAGVPADFLAAIMPIHIATGRRAADGYFECDETGNKFVMFELEHDVLFWQPRTGELATESRYAFALGESQINNPATYAFNGALNIFSTPLDWLRNRGDGCVILDWELAFDMLRDAPRIAVSEDLLHTYRQHMKPKRLPSVSVLLSDRKAVAA